MKIGREFLKALFQLGLMLGAIAFLYFGYIHLEGTHRFLKSVEDAKKPLQVTATTASANTISR